MPAQYAAAAADAPLHPAQRKPQQQDHIHPYGIKDLPEPWDHPLNFDLCQKKIEESPIPVFGIKIRAIAQFAKRYGVKGLEDVKKFSSSMKLPLMVHTGTEPDDSIPACWEDFTRASCELLEKGPTMWTGRRTRPGTPSPG